MSSQQRFGRRDVLLGLGAAAVGVAAGGGALLARRSSAQESDQPHALSSTAGRSAPPPLAPAGEDVRALFGALREGTELAGRWRLEAVYDVRAGAIPVVLSAVGGGERFAVEVFLDAADGPSPIARASGLALFLVNRGDGATPTSEHFGLGVMALGRALDQRRREGAPIPARLETQQARMSQAPRGAFDVPLT